jgi:hypothetical protein
MCIVLKKGLYIYTYETRLSSLVVKKYKKNVVVIHETVNRIKNKDLERKSSILSGRRHKGHVIVKGWIPYHTTGEEMSQTMSACMCVSVKALTSGGQ